MQTGPRFISLTVSFPVPYNHASAGHEVLPA
jgi:hypothetical protein